MSQPGPLKYPASALTSELNKSESVNAIIFKYTMVHELFVLLTVLRVTEEAGCIRGTRKGGGGKAGVSLLTVVNFTGAKSAEQSGCLSLHLSVPIYN